MTIGHKVTAALARLIAVYKSWRAVPALAFLFATVVTPLLLVDGLVSGLLVAAISLMASLMLFVLIGIEISRQDRLRNKSHHELRSLPSTHNVTSIQATPIPEVLSPRNPVKDPLVTIVVTAHNEQAHIGDCLRSVSIQDWSDFECIVIDDASTDNTLENIRRVTREDGRFYCVSLASNQGLPNARNVGISLAKGRYITFLDGDDYLYPGAISTRLRPLVDTQDPLWMGGAFCLWHQIPEDAPLATTPPNQGARDRVSWLDAVDDAPFIASAPLLRTDCVRSIGGFARSLKSAEDFEFWARFLRQGWYIEPVNYVGIAYRQKKRSMIRRTTAAHTATTVDVYSSNYREDRSGSSSPLSPVDLSRPAPFYRQKLATMRRLVRGLVGAVSVGDQDSIDALSKRIQDLPAATFLTRVTDLRLLVWNTSVRFCRYSEDALEVRAASLASHVWNVLGPLVSIDPRIRQPTSSAGTSPDADGPEAASMSVGPPVRSECGEVRVDGISLRELVKNPVAALTSTRDHIFLAPASAYHVYELGPIGEELTRQGHRVCFLVSDRRLSSVQTELEKYPFPLHVYDWRDPDCDRVGKSAKALVVMNDWGEDRAFVEHLQNVGIATFAKVEGVQDFGDIDVGRERRPYTRVDTVLCQGENDRSVFGPRGVVVGSSRLEEIWLDSSGGPTDELAIINLNFTHGVLTEDRDVWLQSAIEGCKRTGTPYVISKHPSERAPVADPNVVDLPVRYLLTVGSVLISRFSTVPFEAMARGVPFVYHNPHGERVPTFSTPDGAFWVSRDAKQLEAAVIESRTAWGNYRKQAAPFFRQQVDVDESRPSARRSCRAILDRVGG